MIPIVRGHVVVALAFVAVAVGCGRESAPVREAAPAAATRKDEVTLSAEEQRDGAIEVAPAASTDRGEELRVPGRIALAENHTWRVGIRTDGVVVASLAGVGDYVRTGQVLARYHADEVRDSRAQYRAAQAEVAKAEAAVALTQRNADRAARLLEMKAGSVMQLEQARQDLTAAQAEAKRAETEVERLKDLLEDDLRVPADPKAGDETAGQVPIVAPASGFILEKKVTLGRAIHTENDTFVIGDLSEVWMLASVRQEQLGQLRVGQSASVTLNGADGATFTGKITNLGQELDPKTRTMQVRIVLSNLANQLRPEMLATAAIPVGRTQTTVVVPSDALQQVDGQDVVFVRVAPDRFAVRAVKAGQTADGMTPILQGVKEGDQVVVRGSFVVKSQLLRASLEQGD